MKTRFVVLIAVGCMLIGGAAGAYGTFRFGTSFVTASNVLRESAEAVMTVKILDDLRSGKSGAAEERLEAQLDSALIGLGGYLKTDPKLLGHTESHALAVSRAYRDKYPRQNLAYPDIDKAVADALSMTNDATKGRQ